MDFTVFQNAVAKQIAKLMKEHTLFRVSTEKNELWDVYLGAFPEGTDPIFRKNTEHTCSCCRQFINNIGDMVAIIDGKKVSIWDVVVEDPTYQLVANALSAAVHSKAVCDRFISESSTIGKAKTFEQLLSEDKKILTWNHFHATVARQHVARKADIGALLNQVRSSATVFKGSLEQITVASVETVQELIAQNSIYRGAENSATLAEFLKIKKKSLAISADELNTFIWATAATSIGAATGIKNTALGTLLVDISNDRPLEDSVRAYEAMVAPTNYKRPTALVTKAMIDKAKIKLDELNLTSALQRRYANLGDITINNVLFADRSTRAVLSDNPLDELMPTAPATPKNLDKVEEIPITTFIKDILPLAKTVEVLFENRLEQNLVSLVTAADPTAEHLFKWNNHFSWSYNGNVADSIRERVKKAGGSVEGVLCCRLAWNYSDDLDFHMREPSSYNICFSNRRRLSPAGGMLDVDANGADGQKENPVENIFYADDRKMVSGVYQLSVNNFSRRSQGVGFDVEIEVDGTLYTMSYNKALANRQTVDVATIRYDKSSKKFTVESNLSTGQQVGGRQREVWSLTTQSFHPVKAIMLSPNHWDGAEIGNKHFFFMLHGCVNAEEARGFYNEFIKAELNPHRKVMELVGSKMMAESVNSQLSGLGFSDTQRNSLICRVTGNFSRLIKVVF